MLILARRKDEGVKIGDAIFVLVAEIYGNYVKLGFDAPATVPIVRAEIGRLVRRGPEPLALTVRRQAACGYFARCPLDPADAVHFGHSRAEAVGRCVLAQSAALGIVINDDG